MTARRPDRLARRHRRAARRPTTRWRRRCGARARRWPWRAVARRARGRTFALTDLAWAAPARRGGAGGDRASTRPRAVVYSSTTAALLWPAPGRDPLRRARGRQPPRAPRDLAAAGRAAPPRGGAAAAAVERGRRWPRRRRRTRAGGRRAGPGGAVGPPAGERDIAAVTYGANPEKKGLDRVLAAWRAARREGETLVVAGLGRARDERRACASPGMLAARPSTARCCGGRGCSSRAPRREDYGIAQLEALADGCVLVTHAGAGPVRGAAAGARARPAAGRRRPRRGDPDRARRPGARLRERAAGAAARRARRAAVDARGGRARRCRRCWATAARARQAVRSAVAPPRSPRRAITDAPRHAASPASATPTVSAPIAQSPAVGQRLRDDERGEQRRRHHRHDAGEPARQLAAAERDRADRLDRRRDHRAARAIERPASCSVLTARISPSSDASEATRTGTPGGAIGTSTNAISAPARRRRARGRCAAPRSAARRRTPGRSRRGRAPSGRRAPSRRARRRSSRSASRRTGSRSSRT